MTKKELSQISRQYKQQFYLHNKGALLLTLLCSIAIAFSNLALSWLMQQLIDLTSGKEVVFSLAEMCLFAAALAAGILVTLLLSCYAKPRFLRRAMQQYKDFAFSEMVKKSIYSFSGEGTATYLSALSNDVNSIEMNYLSKLPSLLEQVLMFFGAFTMMLFYSPLLTLVAFALSLGPVVASLITGNRLAAREKIVSDKNEGFIGMVKDALSGFSVMKSFKAEREIYRLFKESNADLETAKQNRRRTEILIQTIGSVAGFVAQIGVFLFGAYLAVSGKGVTAGVVIVFVQLMNFVIQPIAEVPQILANRKAAKALICKLAEAMHSNVRNEGQAVAPKLESGISVKALSFAYEPEKPILNEISMHFEVGKSYAVVGGSGSGKSTLLNLLMGSSEDYGGKILFDGNELREISSESLYDLISIVQQNVFVFQSSVKNNVTMFRDFDEARLQKAIAMSGLSALIAERGTDYACGENGSGLSGGERQRISIARCILRGTPVMLVDEATAALDAKTAFDVTNSILALSDITRIIVTHRLEEPLMRQYDGIYVLKNGSVIEEGSFDALMDQKGYFYSLFTISQ